MKIYKFRLDSEGDEEDLLNTAKSIDNNRNSKYTCSKFCEACGYKEVDEENGDDDEWDCDNGVSIKDRAEEASKALVAYMDVWRKTNNQKFKNGNCFWEFFFNEMEKTAKTYIEDSIALHLLNIEINESKEI